MSETRNPVETEENNADIEKSRAESRRAFIKKLAYIPPAMQTFILVDNAFAGDDDDDDDDDD